MTVSTTHDFTCTVNYTDETNTAVTNIFQMVRSGANSNHIDTTNGAGPYAGIPLHIRAKASTAITIKTAGTFTTVTYNVEGVIAQVQ